MYWVLRALMLGSVFYGTINAAGSAWALGDVGVGLKAWLKVIAILLLRKPALRALKDYERKRKGSKMKFNPKELDIKNADYWEKQECIRTDVFVRYNKKKVHDLTQFKPKNQ